MVWLRISRAGASLDGGVDGHPQVKYLSTQYVWGRSDLVWVSGLLEQKCANLAEPGIKTVQFLLGYMMQTFKFSLHVIRDARVRSGPKTTGKDFQSCARAFFF